ncbi:Phospho-N-acetylmuramoyl-pentapeptide-transferase [Lachnospiraceae bacterium NK3A20]|jgi:phospho-N-acetylmuramoyl-pentapeptide-transferase|nr:Phospho-N-acetylmuramoyl-pentapeptide-transferase [Lachnospiraceae bacterium NK3A20]
MLLETSEIVNLVLPLIIAFCISAVIGKFLIPELIRMKAEQTERAEGPDSHKKKTGTPNMGGIMFIAALVITCLIFSVKNPDVVPVVFLTLGFGLVGFADDFIKVKKRRSEGLTVRQKMLFQIVIAVVFGLILVFVNHIDLSMKVPFAAGHFFDLGWLSFPALVFIAVATVNGTNFTDGIDGLASCVTIAVALFFAIAAVLAGSDAAVAATAMIGALLGFLLYNANPAKVFMGDTGALALGGFVVGIAYVLQLPLFIPIVGFIYLLEVVSVILQVCYFKATHGKRLFRMAPIHHHFELGGWTEVRVVALFTVITVILCSVGLIALW